MTFDLTADAVEIAFIALDVEPIESDWITATWTRTVPKRKIRRQNRVTLEYRYVPVTATVDDDTDTAYARVLVGPGGDLELPDSAAYLQPWIRIHDSPEVIVAPAQSKIRIV